MADVSCAHDRGGPKLPTFHALANAARAHLNADVIDIGVFLRLGNAFMPRQYFAGPDLPGARPDLLIDGPSPMGFS